MLKRLSVMAAVFFLLTAFITPALAGILYDATKAISDAEQNNGYKYINKNGDTIQYVASAGLSKITDASGNSYGFLVYGQPHGDQDKNGQYRYVGYTYYGEDVTNMDFPADQNANGADFASAGWISQPWEEPNKSVIASSDPMFTKFPGDGDPKYNAAILAGIMAYGGTNASNGYTISSTDNPDFWNNIELFVHILAPPTQYAWGIGRMWHTDASGNLLYVTIPIAPYTLLGQAQLIVTPSTAAINIGQTQQYIATYYPQGQQAGNGQDVTISSKWTVDNGTIATIGSNNGLATGNSSGTTQVTASYNDGSNTLIGNAQLVVQVQQPGKPNNLSVQITNYPAQVYSGDPIPITAMVTNTSGKYVMTDLQWKVNGGLVKDKPKFDLMTSQGDTYTMTAPSVSKATTYTFEVDVNPGHDRPPDETSWADNIAICTVTVLPRIMNPGGDLLLWIDAPSFVKNSARPQSWTFTVWVTPPYIPPPPPPPPDSDSPPPPPPKVDLNIFTTGGERGDNYSYSTGKQDIVPIEPSWQKTIGVAYRDESPIPVTFTFPWSGVWGQQTEVQINANGVLTSWIINKNAEADKLVEIGEVPIPPKEQVLTR